MGDDSPDWFLDDVQRDDVELLATGGYAPLTGFLTRAEVASVRRTGRLPGGAPWPTPITLAVDEQTADAAQAAGRLALRGADGTVLAQLRVEDEWSEGAAAYLGGPVTGVRPPTRPDFADLRRSVPQIRAELGDGPVLVAQPPGLVDVRTSRSWKRAAEATGGRLLLFPPVGADPERLHVHRVRVYRRLLGYLPAGSRLRLLPSARHPATAEAQALHAAVARNAGATHLLLGAERPHQDLVRSLGLTPVDPEEYTGSHDPVAGVFHPDVAVELQRADPPRSRRGLVVLLTGLSGSGKSTVAQVLRARLLEAGDRAVTLLDGDLVRRHLSKGLGFSREDRDLNVRRIGFVASEIARHGGIAIGAPIAPYDQTRRAVRSMVEAAGGGFVLVHVATPLEVCEARDVKGLYARARAGELTGFTGIDDPYEAPSDAEVVVDTADTSPSAGAERILSHLLQAGWYEPNP